MTLTLVGWRARAVHAGMRPPSWKLVSVWFRQNGFMAAMQGRFIQLQAHDDVETHATSRTHGAPSIVAFKRCLMCTAGAVTRIHAFHRAGNSASADFQGLTTASHRLKMNVDGSSRGPGFSPRGEGSVAGYGRRALSREQWASSRRQKEPKEQPVADAKGDALGADIAHACHTLLARRVKNQTSARDPSSLNESAYLELFG